jgi:pimeloyl-ACP methyl ester carboxylesterase
MLRFVNTDPCTVRLSLGIDAAMRYNGNWRHQEMERVTGYAVRRVLSAGWILCGMVLLGAVDPGRLGVRVLCANDAYYRTLLPEMFPPTPAPVNQLGLCNTLFGRAGIGRPRQMVVLADKPRQAAVAALSNPVLGVTLAGYALSAGIAAEHAKLATCVDLYFETVAFSWNFLKSPGASARPEYELAWQLYHNGLARLMGAGQRFGRLDPSTGLHVDTAAGSLVIPTTYQGFAWKSEDFSRIEVVSSLASRKLQHHYGAPGLGVPLVVIRERQQSERFYNNQTAFGATVVLRPSLAVLAGMAPPLGADSSHGPVEFYDPLRVSSVAVGQQKIAMAMNTSAPLEYAVKNTNYSPLAGLLQPGSAEAGQEKLFLLEPRQPGKFPLVFVHGFFSTPAIWANVANEIMASPGLRDRFQIMAYRYPTGRPFVESAAILRRELNEFVKTYDRDGQDPSMDNMAMIGHSMGGIVAKLTVTRSDDRLWDAVANRPLSELNISETGRQRLAELFYFEPLPFVRRVVFMGTPHDGAMMASLSLGRISSKCIQQSTADLIEHDLLVKQNPGVFSPEISKRIPTSIDMMESSSCLLQAVQKLCPGENVQLHSIMGTKCLSLLDGCGDGVVSVKSAQHPWVSTEKRVHATHPDLHKNEDSIQELKCILRRHILEANDEPGVDESECVTPDSVMPEQIDPCPPEGLLDECPDDVETADPCDENSSVSMPIGDAESTRMKAPLTLDPASDDSVRAPADPPELEGPELVVPSDLPAE